MTKRIGFFYIACLITVAVLMIRLFSLAVGYDAERAAETVQNRTREIVLYRTKGLIYDENLVPIAGGQAGRYAVVNPREFPKENLGELLAGTGADPETVKEKLGKETPFVLKLKNEMFDLPGVIIVEGESRYSGVAPHLLGYLDSAGEVGLSGVEKEFDALLGLYASEASMVYSSDAVKGVMSGMEMQIQKEEQTKNGVVLSLDAELCLALEKSMENWVETGAAVVLNCKSGEIKALSSRPGYEEENISSYLKSENGELINRAFSAKTVGSVFKIVVAACAIEQEMEDFSYHCEGGVLIGDHHFSCHQQSGHGEIGLKDAFAQSCNSYFIALGQMLGEKCIEEMARRFGYGESIDVLGSLIAASGNIPDYQDRMSLANLSIGQGELTASPLQVARMTAVVANGGILPKLQLYTGLYIDGRLKKEDAIDTEERILSEMCASKLKELCVYTVENGTGKEAKPEIGGAGGKTASGQTGNYTDGKESLDVYFTGFYPADDPQYVITVFAENGVSGGKTCAPVFREICNFMAENGLTA